MSGAFLPRALAKPQRIPLPSKRTLKEPMKETQSSERTGLSLDASVHQVNNTTESTGCGKPPDNVRVEGSMGQPVDIDTLDDDKLEEIRLEKGVKRRAESHELASHSKKRRENDSHAPIDELSVQQEEAIVMQVVEERHQQDGAAVTSSRSTQVVAPKVTKKQPKKVFPYGNYDRYYGYRFGKALAEDPRLSVFRKEWFKGKACLDVGCNEGYVTIAVAQKFECASMLGVDIDATLIAKAKGHLKREAAVLRQAKKPQRRRLDLEAETVRSGEFLPVEAPSSPLGGSLVEGAENFEVLRSLVPEAGDPQKDVPAAQERETELTNTASADLTGSGNDISATAAGPAEDDRNSLPNTEDRGCSSMAEVFRGRDADEYQPAEAGIQNGGTLDNPGKTSQVDRSQEGFPDPNQGGCVDEVAAPPPALAVESNDGPPKIASAAAEPPPAEAPFPRNITFRAENFVTSPVEEEKYDVVMSLSVVKWIHLNWGDKGLLRYFRKVHTSLKPGGLFILEPQPWKSYKNNRAVSEVTQRHFKEIKILPEQFSDVLLSQIGFRTSDVVSPAVPGSLGGFGRPLHLYRK